MNETIQRANARSRRVPPVFFRILLALVISAITLAVAVPMLARQGIHLQGWMMWGVILASLGLCVGPDLLARIRSRE